MVISFPSAFQKAFCGAAMSPVPMASASKARSSNAALVGAGAAGNLAGADGGSWMEKSRINMVNGW